MRVGVDLDGVVYDFAASVREYLVGCGWDRAKCTPATTWEFYRDWGLSDREFVDVCNDGVDHGVIFTHGDPEPGSSEALYRIREAGHTIHVVTDRKFGKPGAAAEATISWLARHDLPFDDITFTSDKRCANLATMVDDKLSNYDQLEKSGVWTYLLDRPWNRVRESAARYRVSSLFEYARIVCGDE